MQKRNRNEWKKIVTSVKEVLGIEYKTRDIYNTKDLQSAIREMAFIYAKENREDDIAYNAEIKFLQSQIIELQKQAKKYRNIAEETTKANNNLINKYENQKSKSWLQKLLG